MPPKGMYGCGAADAHVDADHAHVGVAAELFGIELALREDARAVAEFGLPDEFEGVVDVRDFDRGDQRPNTSVVNSGLQGVTSLMIVGPTK